MNKPVETGKKTNRLAKLRYPIQAAALLIALLAPFALFWTLNQGNTLLAVVFFVLMVLSLVLTALAG